MDAGIDSGSGPIHHGGGRPRVVVGVDGSPGSRAALVHAFTAAAQRGAELDVVSSYHVTLVWTGGSPLEVPDTEAIGVVVGSRGRGAIRALLLGSVALQCAMHAPGPVMLVHPQRSKSTEGDTASEPAMAEL